MFHIVVVLIFKIRFCTRIYRFVVHTELCGIFIGMNRCIYESALIKYVLLFSLMESCNLKYLKKRIYILIILKFLFFIRKCYLKMDTA